MGSGIAVLALSASFAAACGSKPGSSTPTAVNPFGGANCSAVKLPSEPELMAWDSQSRAQLDKLRHQGVVAVRYVANGCDVQLELLPDCIGPKNRYVYSPMSSSDKRIAKNVDELLSELPVGAANVSPSLKGGGTVRADFHLVGAAALPVGSTITEYDLLGADCKQATHVVSAVYVGGFGIATEGADAATNAFTGGATAIAREGYPAVCDRAGEAEEAGCSVPLRVALVPLNGQAPPPTCPPNWTFDGKKCVKPAESAPICSTIGASTDGCMTSEPDAGAPDTRAFDQAAIERVVRDRSPNAKRSCWESAPTSVRSLSVNVAVTVDPKGRVVVAEPQLVVAEGPTDVANSIARCIASDVLTWEFPPPDATKSFSLPVHWLRQ